MTAAPRCRPPPTTPQHFLEARMAQIQHLAGILDRPPLVVAPYDAELFGHWWYEGPEFLDYFVRKACYDQKVFTLITPGGIPAPASDEPGRHARAPQAGARKATGASGSTKRTNGFIRTCTSRRNA